MIMAMHEPPAYTTRPMVAFTTPPNYAARLSNLLSLKGFDPIWCPTLIVQTTPSTISALKPYLYPQSLHNFSAIAFTSRTSITTLSQAIAGLEEPPLSPSGEVFTIAALGKDSELINHRFVAKFCSNFSRVRILVPPKATPSDLVKTLGDGGGRRVLCPVPVVAGLEEPPVVPNFLRELESNSWVPVRVNAYETRWAGKECAKQVVERSERGELDAVVFTSTAEVEGLLKSLKEFGLDWTTVKKRCPGMVAAAHGPVTAAGAERLGVKVELVSAKFDSFEGVVNSLYLKFNSK
ncbi:hypothetical protein FNV43_RR03435 [Rhamnella rubrinervis]|uniref:Tetrapyrrole biosynthesis uroporphyrinogen III synthase domain-containing protein n=1 Tax=Rhamnella rubrinervis TaxID=2594499 RepID=A0A8K0HHR6_9ROSA|nr:hypothetical protein FNV43_RR03435 [Rhamnella rubrinervis]